MVHLTHVGYNAGHPYCNAPRRLDESYCHMPYLYGAAAIAFIKGHITCPECREIAIDVENDRE